MANNPEVAVLMPTSDELGVTIDRSINNLGLRMAERPDVNWSLHIGVNGSNAGEEIAKVNDKIKLDYRYLKKEFVNLNIG